MSPRFLSGLLGLIAAPALCGCGPSAPTTSLPKIHVKGSDTMIAATAWAETYDRAKVEVGGGGSGIGIGELVRGTIDIASTSRPMTNEEFIEADQKDETIEKRLIRQFSEKHGVTLE